MNPCRPPLSCPPWTRARSARRMSLTSLVRRSPRCGVDPLPLDSGARRSEVAALTVDAVDLREKTATVLGKGRRPRIITFGSRNRPLPSRAADAP